MRLKQVVTKKFLPFFAKAVKYLHTIKIINNKISIKVGKKLVTCNPKLSRKYIEKKISYYNKQRKLVPIDQKNFWKFIHSKNVYIGNELNKVLASYLPYVPGIKTTIFANNFFSANYSIRMPLVVQISIVDSSSNILHSQILTIEPYSQSLIEIPVLELSLSSENPFIFIQCYNPRLNVNHGGHDGYYRVHGFYSKKFKSRESYSSVHSMPYGENNCLIVEESDHSDSVRGFLPEKMKPKCDSFLTNYFLSEVNRNQISIKQDKGNLLRLKTMFKNKGYVLVKDSLKSLNGIWHDGPDSEQKYISDDFTKYSNGITGFYVPSFESNAPFLLFDKSSLGFDNSCNVEVKAEFNEINVTENFRYEGEPMLVDCLDLFNKYKPKGPFSIYIKFIDIPTKKLNPLMVQVIMRDGNKLLGDGVHSGTGYTKIRPHTSVPGGMLIWGPYFKKSSTNSLKWDYSLYHSFSENDSQTGIVKVKIFTDMGYEFIYNINSLPAVTNFHITCNELDKLTGFKSKVLATASIQFECRSSNIDGCFYVFDPISGLTGSDHLTGG